MTIGERFDDTLQQAKVGDHEALGVLYEDVAPLVIGYLRGHRARDPEDLAGEVFVTMLRKINAFEGDERQFRSWLLTIAHRRMVDELRRRGRRPASDRTIDDLVGSSAPVAAADVAGAALAQLESERILRLIGELSDEQRAVLLLRVLGDLSVTETAAVLGKSETAVKAMMRRAVIRTRSALVAEGAGPTVRSGRSAASPTRSYGPVSRERMPTMTSMSLSVRTSKKAPHVRPSSNRSFRL